MNWLQKKIKLSPKPRGFHLITNEIINNIPELSQVEIGTCHLFICHTSASITLNENASPDVRVDMEQHFNSMVPEDEPYYTHTCEGSDDMPAHIKATLIGSSIQLPITKGKFNVGTWQGIYLCEHRDFGGPRSLIFTINGKWK